MNVRRITRTTPKRHASNTTLSRGEAWPVDSWEAGGLSAVQPLGDQPVGAREVDLIEARRSARQLVENFLLNRSPPLCLGVGNRVEHHHRIAGDEPAGVPLLEAEGKILLQLKLRLPDGRPH